MTYFDQVKERLSGLGYVPSKLSLLGEPDHVYQAVFFNPCSPTVIVAQYDGGGCWRYVIVEGDGNMGRVYENEGQSLADYLATL